MSNSLSREEQSRYQRHLVMPEVGVEGQLKLKAARILLIGVGGLGSPLGLYLAAAGIGTLGVIDADSVEQSNLQRQVLYGTGSVGRAKVDACRERLLDLNPSIRVRAYPQRLTSEKALALFSEYDLIVDGTDNFPTRYLVNDACVLTGKPYVYGSVFRFQGQVSLFAPGQAGPCYRCLYPEPPPAHLAPSCAEGGVLGVLPGVVGTLQATEAIKWVLQSGESLVGRLLTFDALRMRFQEIKFSRDPGCPVCGDCPSLTELINYREFCGVGEPGHEIEPEEFLLKWREGWRPTVLDVRTRAEWTTGNLEEYGARLLPLSELPLALNSLNKEQDMVVVCRSGARSAEAQRMLLNAGFERVYNFSGGMLAWSTYSG